MAAVLLLCGVVCSSLAVARSYSRTQELAPALRVQVMSGVQKGEQVASHVLVSVITTVTMYGK